jgi:hypothetical protein
MVVTSDGEAIGNPKFFARDEKNLARAQRQLCKKKKGSRNRENAANNVLAEGLSVAACGEPVRPERAKSQSGKPRRSRKALP